MRIVPYLLLVLLSVFFASCKHSGTHDGHVHHGNEAWYSDYEIYPYADLDDTCWIGYVNDSFKLMLYDFDFKGFDPDKMIEHFSTNAKVENITLEDVPGYPYHLYRFYDSLSRFEFLVKSFDSSEYYFIDRAQLISNLVDFKNGITIGMIKSDFKNAMNIENNICDTFRISDGELPSDYDFIFVNDTLDKILIWAVH
jgi:hypothetical protein